MEKNLKITSIVALSLAVVAVGFSVLFYGQKETYKTELRYAEEKAFSELVTSVSKIDTAITKSAYSTTPSYSVSMLAEVWKESETAKNSLSQINETNESMIYAQEFISKIGDYSLTMLRKVASGQSLSTEEIEYIKSFAQQCEMLALELGEIKYMYNNGESDNIFMNITTFDEQKVSNVGSFTSAMSEIGTENEDVDQKTQEFATMIYDGPFSSHIDKIEPEFLKNEQVLTEDMARQKSAEFLKTSINEIQVIERVDGQIPVYKIRSTKEDDDIYMDVTVSGGHVLNFINYREVQSEDLTAEQAVETAINLMAEKGYSNFIETYFVDQNGIVTINFAYEQDGIIVYPDLLKISIYKDDGTLAGVEARGFIMSHKTRDTSQFEIAISTARKSVSSDLEIIDENKAIIPTSGKNEVATYEFKCKDKNEKNIIVYVNAKTGEIENMLILIEDENGTLAM